MICCSCGNELVSVEAICELCDVPVIRTMSPLQSCLWTEDCSDWQPGCDTAGAFQFNNDGPEENGFRFCPYCGRPLVAIPADDEDKR